MTTENQTIEQKLAAFFGVALDHVEETRGDLYGLTVYTVYGKEYAVGTDSECDDAWDKSLDSYLEECIYPELKGNLAQYFDNEKWKRDAEFDGRGHSLSSYDGEEIELGGDFYAFRTN